MIKCGYTCSLLNGSVNNWGFTLVLTTERNATQCTNFRFSFSFVFHSSLIVDDFLFFRSVQLISIHFNFFSLFKTVILTKRKTNQPFSAYYGAWRWFRFIFFTKQSHSFCLKFDTNTYNNSLIAKVDRLWRKTFHFIVMPTLKYSPRRFKVFLMNILYTFLFIEMQQRPTNKLKNRNFIVEWWWHDDSHWNYRADDGDVSKSAHHHRHFMHN